MANVPLRTSNDTEGRAAEMMTSLEGAGKDLAILRAVANAETAIAPFVRYAVALMNKLALPYEWAEHHPLALNAGVTLDELTALEAGEVPDGLSEIELACIEACDAILAAKADDGFGRARELLDDQQYSELAIVLGWWAGCVPVIIRVLDLDGDRPAVPAAG
jgi:hypothetical protein